MFPRPGVGHRGRSGHILRLFGWGPAQPLQHRFCRGGCSERRGATVPSNGSRADKNRCLGLWVLSFWEGGCGSFVISRSSRALAGVTCVAGVTPTRCECGLWAARWAPAGVDPTLPPSSRRVLIRRGGCKLSSAPSDGPAIHQSEYRAGSPPHLLPSGSAPPAGGVGRGGGGGARDARECGSGAGETPSLHPAAAALHQLVAIHQPLRPHAREGPFPGKARAMPPVGCPHRTMHLSIIVVVD